MKYFILDINKDSKNRYFRLSTDEVLIYFFMENCQNSHPFEFNSFIRLLKDIVLTFCTPNIINLGL